MTRRATYTPGEAQEIRELLVLLRPERRAVDLMTRAKLRRIGWLTPSDMKRPTSAIFKRQLADGGIVVERSDHPPARITPHRSVNQISRLAVGVTGRLLADSQSGKRAVVLTITRPWSVATIPGAGLRRGRR